MEGQQTLSYQFEPANDLMDKSRQFIFALEKMQDLTIDLNNIVKKETDDSKGLMIEKIKETIQEKARYQQLYYDATKTSMKNAANRYTDIINDMTTQQLTLYYDFLVKE